MGFRKFNLKRKDLWMCWLCNGVCFLELLVVVILEGLKRSVVQWLQYMVEKTKN